MMKLFLLVIAAIGLLLSVVPGQSTSPIDKPKFSIEDISFLEGCWEQNDPTSKLSATEQWMMPLADSMLGMSRTVRDYKLVGFEYMRIVNADEGIVFISKPSQNTEETSFRLMRSEKNQVVFENPNHDFPQRIIYKLSAPDKLDARIEGTMKGKFSGIDFPYKRANCK